MVVVVSLDKQEMRPEDDFQLAASFHQAHRQGQRMKSPFIRLVLHLDLW